MSSSELAYLSGRQVDVKPQITVGVVEFATTAAYVIIFTVLWRAAAGKMADTDLGKAMAGIYS